MTYRFHVASIWPITESKRKLWAQKIHWEVANDDYDLMAWVLAGVLKPSILTFVDDCVVPAIQQN